MTTPMQWRYVAIDASSGRRYGELAGVTAGEVRASLRRIGLQVVDLRPVRSPWQWTSGVRFLQPVIDAFNHHLRGKNRGRKAELYDSLATMLNSGLPLMEAIDTSIESGDARGRRSSARSMLQHVREQLRAGTSGGSLAQALRDHPGWFDPTEVAMIEAGQHGGNLPQVLLALAERHERAGELSHKLLGALTYPLLVLIVGIGVVVFLSVKTLPQLCQILQASKIPIPGLTVKVMWIGQMIAQHWLLLGLLILIAIALGMIVPRIAWLNPGLRRVSRPRIMRTMAVGNLAQGLADLIRSGVPMVDALRVLAPTAPASLRSQLIRAAESVERGEELSHPGALGDPRWFDAEFRRLLDIGQTTGELDVLLERIAQRYQRQTRRLIDRLTALLEPVVIIVLAVLVGTVVMAAILPLLRLQEVLR